jgi:stearoyl-CoA desaturase (Delta-9 desaturase)
MLKTFAFFALAFATLWYSVESTLGINGLFGEYVAAHPFLFTFIYGCLIAHITITCMSLSYHRYHTHKGVIISKWVDMPMQVWLWLVTSLNKVDWVAVHIFHHAHSDLEKDPHSPVQNGIWHALFFGVFDYTKGKALPEVQKIRKTIHTNKLEAYMEKHSFTGPVIMTSIMIVLFGPVWGSLLAVTNFMTSPIFAIGGVNAIAHWWGYRNHKTTDNSRNIGFLFPLNFIICGELDHNNHHAHMRSASFRHRWFEFDIGYVYLKALSAMGLAEFKNVYTPATLKQELSKKMSELIDADLRFKQRCEELAREMNISYQEFKSRLEAYCRGEKVKLERSCRDFMDEVIRTLKANQRLNLKYA